VLSSTYAGRRIVYLPGFSPEGWIAAARDEAVTHAMVVPPCSAASWTCGNGRTPPCRAAAPVYGGGRMPVPVIERALRLLPDVGFVNAYGLTETSSTSRCSARRTTGPRS